MTTILLACAGVVLAMMFATWVWSVVVTDASVVDRVWGLGFVLIAWTAHLLTLHGAPRSIMLLALPTVWGGRLALHIWTRNSGHGEDYRYQAMRKPWGERYWWVSFVTVFLLQGVVMWVVALPLMFAAGAIEPGAPRSAHPPFGALDVVGIALWAIGFAFESVGDKQLREFKADPSNKGKVMDRGLWRYTRHPNYFGDAVMWWGLYALALAAGAPWWTAVGPAMMTLFLTRISGVPLLERRMMTTRPGYRDYVRRTSGFVPWWPKA